MTQGKISNMHSIYANWKISSHLSTVDRECPDYFMPEIGKCFRFEMLGVSHISLFSFFPQIIIPLWNLFNTSCTLIVDSADTLEKVFVFKDVKHFELVSRGWGK